MSFNLLLPRRILTGGHCVRQTSQVLKAFSLSNPLIVTDKYLVNSGILRQVTDFLDEDGVSYDIFDETREDPTTTEVSNCVDVLQRGSYDSVIAVGGGSPMDAAKAAAVLSVHGGKMRDYKAPNEMNKQGLPLIAIPTTAGTGSEVTKFTIITDSETNEKMLCIGMGFLPTVAIVDHTLTHGKPRLLTGCTGVDALCHALEAFVSKRQNDFSDTMALSSLSRIGQNLEVAADFPKNSDARSGMMLGSMEAGLAFSNSSVTLVHGMSRPLGVRFKIPHGMSNAMLVPSVTKFSLGGEVERYAQASRVLGMDTSGASIEDSAEGLVTGLFSLNRRLLIPSLKQFGVDEKAYHDAIPEMAALALASGSPNNNPIVPTQQEIEELYRTVWNDTISNSVK